EVATDAAIRSWVVREDEIERYLANGYQAELIAQGRNSGVTISPLDDRLMAFPVVIQIQPKRWALRLDRKRVTALRPSRVVDAIRSHQKRPAAKPEQIIEMLYRAYRRMVDDTLGKGVTLVELYDVLTLHPEAKRAYSKADFTRDVFLLDTSGLRKTRTGAVVSFPAATGTKGSSKVLTIVPSGGMPKHYYAIRFEGGSV
ncbi:MAG: hypothetical protein N2037_13980, partial [Acidimicrobiales bacterium]|nr:hypothetical protein [Acidimicrobiales bacterium]